MLGTASSGGLLVTALVAIVVRMVAPARPTIATLIELTPVTRRAARVGLGLPSFVLALVGAAAFSLTTPVLAHRVLAPTRAWCFVVVWLLCVGCVSLFASALHEIGTLVLRRTLAVPVQLASGAMAGVIMTAVVSTFGAALLTPAAAWSGSSVFLLSHAAVALVLSPSVGSAAITLMWLTVTGLLVWLSTRSDLAVPLDAVPHIGLPPSHARNPFLGSVDVQLRLVLRNARVWFTAAGGVAALIALYVVASDLPPETTSVLTAGIPLGAMSIALFGSGQTVGWAWIGRMTLVTPSWWVWPMVSVYLVVGSVTAVVLGIAPWSLGLTSDADLVRSGTRALTVFGSALLSGSLFVWSEADPLAGVMGMFLTVLSYGCFLALLAVSPGMDESLSAVIAGLILVLFGMLAAIHRSKQA